MKVHWSEILWCVIWTLATIQTQLNGSEDFLLEKFTFVSFYTGSRKICPLLVERFFVNAFSCEFDCVSFIARPCPSFFCTFLSLYYFNGGTRWRSWLRHCATSRKVAGSIPDGVIGIFHWHNPFGRTMALGLTQPLTEMSTRNIYLGVKAAGA